MKEFKKVLLMMALAVVVANTVVACGSKSDSSEVTEEDLENMSDEELDEAENN